MEKRDEIWVITAAILASSMAFIDGSALNVALPVIQSRLQASAAELLWVANGYLLVLASLILVGGALGDRLGQKRVLLWGIALFALGSAACALAPSIGILIAARIFQGFGGALMIPGSLALINLAVAPERRGQAIGTWSAVSTLVTIIGPFLGGLFSDIGLWRLVFWINIPIAFLAMLCLLVKVPAVGLARPGVKFDIFGTILISLGLAGLAFGFISAADFGFGNPRVWLSLVGGGIAILVFILVEAKSPHAMIPLFLFRTRAFSGANLLTFFLYGALAVVSFFLSLNLVQIQGYSKTLAGLSFLPFSVLLVFMSRWSGSLVDKIGARLPLVLGTALCGLGFAALALSGITRGPIDYWTHFLPGMLIFGLGMGLVVAPLTTTVMGSLDHAYSGTASGVNNAISRIAGVLALAVLGAAALLAFSGFLGAHTQNIVMSEQQRSWLMDRTTDFGALLPPAGLDSGAAQAVQAAIQESFVDSYKLIMLGCAILAWLGTLSAWFLIGPKSKPAIISDNDQ